jgi:hypothetical protein
MPMSEKVTTSVQYVKHVISTEKETRSYGILLLVTDGGGKVDRFG